MNLTDNDKQIECRSTSGSKQSSTNWNCPKAFKKVNIFGHGMDDKVDDYFGKLSDNGHIIKVHFKKNDSNKISIEDEDVPFDFKDYCVSMARLNNMLISLPE
jgi:hypothetical protein